MPTRCQSRTTCQPSPLQFFMKIEIKTTNSNDALANKGPRALTLPSYQHPRMKILHHIPLSEAGWPWKYPPEPSPFSKLSNRNFSVPNKPSAASDSGVHYPMSKTSNPSSITTIKIKYPFMHFHSGSLRVFPC